MSNVMRTLMLSSLAAVSATVALPAHSAPPSEASTRSGPGYVLYNERFICLQVLNGEMHMRTELLFGMSRAGGPDITESEFQSFIDDQVTPRFPDGLTVLSGNGQFRDSRGTIIQEKSKLLILLYPFDRKSSQEVDEIRSEYQAMFQQQSVLRADEESCVSF